MIIKVCGMREPDNIRAVDALEGVTWVGFIFHPRSPRFVSEVPAYMPLHCKRVGVFVNEPQQGILDRMKSFGLDLIQLHGNETTEYCQELRSSIGSELKIIKMIPITTTSDLEAAKPYESIVDFFLFDYPINLHRFVCEFQEINLFFFIQHIQKHNYRPFSN